MRLERRYLPSTASLRALEALDRLGTATAVAQELDQTQSAISRQLRGLEEQLGTALLIRERQRLRLTPAAQEYAAEIRGALETITRASVRLAVNPRGGTLDLAVLPSFGMHWLVPRLPDFARRHPGITINLATRLRRFDFAGSGFDAAIRFGTGTAPGTASLRLRDERLIAVAAPALMADVVLAKPADLLALPLLHIETRPHAWRDWFAGFGRDPGQLAGTMHDQFSTIAEAARHGLGVALLPDYLAADDLASGRLLPAYGPSRPAPGSYRLVWPGGAQAPALGTFRAWLATQAEDDSLPR